MNTLPTMLRLSCGLLVVAIVMLATIPGNAQSSTPDDAQLNTAMAAATLACVEPPLGRRTASVALPGWQYSDAQVALDPEESEREGDQEVPPLDGHILGRVSAQLLPIVFATDYGVERVTRRASALLSSYPPRGPPNP